MAWSLGGAKHPHPSVPFQNSPISRIHPIPPMGLPHPIFTDRLPVLTFAYDLGTSQNTYGSPKTLTTRSLSPKTIMKTPPPSFQMKTPIHRKSKKIPRQKIGFTGRTPKY